MNKSICHLPSSGFYSATPHNMSLNDAVSEDVSDSFLCCVCLELLYKPVVLCCGHVSCFWCVHKSMNGLRDSNCPICRNPYKHFPAICEMMHFLLLKMYPIAYKRRELQILDFEREQDCFSPQLDYNAYEGYASKGENCISLEQRQSESKESAGITTTDVQCLACKKLLFQPVVLNCGHVYCKTCIVRPGDSSLKCQVCQNLHPGDFPKVCLELDKFLEDNFSNEYTMRRDSVRPPQIHNESSNTGSTRTSLLNSSSTENSLPRSSDPQSSVHAGVGCDSCGVLPIVGDRYKCKDCFEKIGFDLCGDCYNNPSKVIGRFNQQHTQEHRLELVNLNTVPSVMRSGVLWAAYASTPYHFDHLARNLSVVPLPHVVSRSNLPSTEDVNNQNGEGNDSSPIDDFRVITSPTEDPYDEHEV